MKPLIYPFVVLLLCLGSTGSRLAFADEGNPVAIRSWPDGGITIETMWNIHCGSNLSDEAKQLLPRDLDLECDRLDIGTDVTIRRLANEDQPKVMKDFDGEPKPNDLTVFRTDLASSDTDPAIWSTDISVDGVDMLNINSIPPEEIRRELDGVAEDVDQPSKPPVLATLLFKSLLGNMDIEIDVDVIIANTKAHDESTLLLIASKLRPRWVIVHPSLARVGDQKVLAIAHNTFAITATDSSKKKPTRFVSLATKPYEMSAELADLFAKKETACKNSRNTFAKLSIDQMNFRPSNGTHTPRWNSEHMMGRELLFFSQIYHAVDSTIPVMDLNPRQMPDDYEMAHPDWTGHEEARQTERVEAFTRRFAYLLDGMDLDQKAKGSKFWSPRALLEQMQRHYNEHTANVRKKMKLSDWPKQ